MRPRMPFAPDDGGWLAMSRDKWHFAARRLFPMMLFFDCQSDDVAAPVLRAAGSDANTLLVSLDERQMPVRPQAGHGLPGQRHGFKIRQCRTLYAERFTSRASVFVAPQHGRPDPLSGSAAQGAICWFWKHGHVELDTVYIYSIADARRKGSPGITRGTEGKGPRR